MALSRQPKLPDEPLAWLVKVARNQVLQWNRSEQRRAQRHIARAIGAGYRLAEFAQCSGDCNLINGLVSVAISGITFSIVEELSQQADAPNLYWALASLPDVLWDQRGWIFG